MKLNVSIIAKNKLLSCQGVSGDILTLKSNMYITDFCFRLHTVMDSDKVIVMDAGSAVEFNHPHVLLQNTDSIFYGLVKKTGKAMAEHLTEIAEKVSKIFIPFQLKFH